MAEPNPTNPTEEKETAAPHKAPPSLLDDAIDLGKWIWEILRTLAQIALAFGQWCKRNPLGAVAVAGIAATFYYFLVELTPFVYGCSSLARWVWRAWVTDEGDLMGHGIMVPLITLGLFFYHRKALVQAPRGRYGGGLVTMLAGIVLYVLAIRCLNPRTAMVGVMFLLYGSIWFALGMAAARVVLFPIAFLAFMIPAAAIEQATAQLQFIITAAVGVLAHLMGVSILAVGTTLTAMDGSFNFEIAEGCSGIRSLAAMSMITAIYVHITQDRLWKKLLIFSGALGFAIVGNIGRIFTIVLLGRFYDPKVAAGVYHDYSGFVFFPIALLSMLLFAKLVNLDFTSTSKPKGRSA